MAGTFTFLGIHFVFSFKNRAPLIDNTGLEIVCIYWRNNQEVCWVFVIEINAMPEHIHFYASMPKTISVAKFMEIVKTNSSKWFHDTFPSKGDFGWQDGYGAFSINKSSENAIIQYIRSQPDHHRKKSFQEEFIGYLNKYGIEYDEKLYMEIMGCPFRPFGTYEFFCYLQFQGLPPAIFLRPFGSLRQRHD